MPSDVDSTQVWKLDASLPSVSGSGEQRVDAAIDELEARGWSPADQFAVRLALSEALENAVEHGNKRDKSKKIGLSMEIGDSRFYASVSDEGLGFRQEDAPDPTAEENIGKISGRGLFLIRNFMTNVWHNDAGNVIFMEKIPTSDEEKKE
ncbi:MAG: ATP-binding protein [Thermoguttaceae bacterium]|nr:ATP-binding protein [Thermoguttaceae bacterium]MBR5759417.1 ATP-binding protein [Thermoguttaceae bacterium]